MKATRTGRLVAFAAFAALAALISLIAVAGSPAVALAADPCPTDGPSPWPGGVDIYAACIARQLTASYTKQESGFDPLTILAWILLISFIVALALDLGWQLVRRRAARRLAPVAPAEVWLCPGCCSFNHADAARCYRCRRRRPEDASTLDATAPLEWKQRFGRPFDGK